MKYKKTLFTVIILIIITLGITITYSVISKKENKEPKSVYIKTKKIPVSTVSASKKTVNEALSIAGVTRANTDVQVISETQGKVTSTSINVGDYVSQGDILAQVDDEIKQAGYASAKANYEKIKKDFERITNLHNSKYISDADFENTRVGLVNSETQFIYAQKQLNDTKIKAPISGIISDKYINEGTTVGPGTPVANIVDIAKLKIKVNIGEKEIMKIKKGDIVAVTTDLYPGFNFKGKVENMSPKGNASLTFPVEISFLNDKNRPLKDGMSVQVSFSFGTKNINSIPRVALIGSYKNPQVYIVNNGIAEIKNLTIGNEYQTDVEVISGLGENDKIIVSGQNNLSNGIEVDEQK